MRRFFITLLTSLLLVGPATADQTGDEIASVISSQIAAFQRSDVAGAFSYASPSIQNMFGSSERFGKMVQGGYPMIWRPARFAMQRLVASPDGFVQTVIFEAQDGGIFEAAYDMIKVDGAWRINGVSLRRLPGVAS